MNWRKRKKRISDSGQFSSLDFWFAPLVFLLPVFLSLPLLSRDLLAGPAAEYVLAALNRQLLPFPGFPLFLMFTHFFTHFFSSASSIWQLHLINALYTAGAALMIYFIGRKLHFTPLISFLTGLLFYFLPWIWQSALLPSPQNFHLLLLCAMLYMTLDLFAPTSGLLPKLPLYLWALLLGLTMGQEFNYWPWGLSCLATGVFFALPNLRLKGKDWFGLTLIGLAGIFLPYLYFLRTTPLADPLMAAANFTAKSMHHWPQYLSLGMHDWLAERRLTSPLLYLNALKNFCRQSPFLPLAIALLGWGLGLQKLVIKTPMRDAAESMALRLTIILITLSSLLLQLLLVPLDPLPLQQLFSLAMVLTALFGIEYCTLRFGHATQPRLHLPRSHPTLLAVLLVGLIPLLALLHSYPSVRAQVRIDSRYAGTLPQNRTLLRELPPNAVVALPTTDYSWVLRYLQIRENLRPDVRLIPGPDDRRIRALAAERHSTFATALTTSLAMQALEQARRQNAPLFLLTPAMPATAWMDYLLTRYSLTEIEPMVNEWSAPGRIRCLKLFRLQDPPPPDVPEPHPRSVKYLGDYNHQLRLLSGHLHKSIEYRQRLVILAPALSWQADNLHGLENLQLEFRIMPVQKTNLPQPPAMLRPLASSRRLAELKPGDKFLQTDYLLLPAALPPGRYQIEVALTELSRNHRLPCGKKNGRPVYFTPCCEFWVLKDSWSSATALTP